MNKKLFMLWTFLLCFVGGVSAQGSEVFNKISSLAELTDGEYLIVGKDERAMGAISGKYFAAIEVTPSNGAITSAGEALVWTIKNVDGKYIISSEGSYVASKGDANAAQAVNAEASASKHTVTLNDDGTFSFADDLVAGRFLQYNSNTDQWRFAYYKGTQNHLMLYKKEAAVVSAVSTPTFTPAGGSFFGTQTVEIACETADAKIYYTLDGNDPTAESAEYTAPVEITETATLKAIAIKGEDKSSIAAAKYTILANIANTVDAPMTVAEALAAIANNSAETLAHADNKVYVKGIVKYIDEISTSFGNATYSIVDAEGDADTLLIYRGKFLENAKFTAEDSAKFVPGSTVVIYGNLINYNGTTPEMTAGNYLASFEEPKAEEATWKDIKVDLAKSTFIQNLTAGTSYKVGLVVNDDETVSAVEATDASADMILDGKYHNEHGWTGWTATVAVEGPVKVGIGQCSFGGGAATITDGEGKVVQFQVAKNGCYSQVQTAENISYGYYLGGATTLTIKYSSYTPYLSIEALTGENLVTYYNEAYTTADASYSAFLVQEYNNGETITLPETNPEPALGYEFSHWATADGTEIKGGEPAADMNIYPVWKARPVATITYSLDGSEAQGVLAVSAETVEQGQTISIPTNTSLYVEGKTLTGWTDGTNTYATGQSVTLNENITVTPVFTANEVALADRTEEVTIKWNFRRDQGAAAVGFERNTGFVVAQAAVNGKTIDVKMDIDATSGKFNNKNHTDWCQVNPGTKFTMPSYKGAVVSLESMNATTTTTIEGSTEYTANGGTVSYTVQGTAETVEIVIGDATWYRSASVVLPAILPENITVDVTDGDIVAAVDAAKATVAKVGDITINLKKGTTYTVSKSIEIPAGLVINGDSAKIDASALDAPFIVMSATPSVELINEYYRVGQVKISNVVVDSIKNSIFYDNNTKYCVVDFAIDNSVLNLATTAVQNEALVSFKMGGAKDFNVTNSTIYGNGIAKYFIRYNNSARLDRYGFDKTTEFQTMNYQNNTFYNVIQAGGQWGNYGGIGGQNYSKFDVQKNIWYNSSNEIIRRMAGGRFSGSNPMTFAKNTYFYNDADNSAKEASYDKSGDILITDPTFADAATGNFTLHVGTQQAKEKTGDPRWLVEYDATQAFALPIVVDVVEGDIIAALDSVKATVDKVGDITINLKKDAAYTVSKSIEIPAGLVINGDSAKIDASALDAPFIVMSATPSVELINEYYRVGQVKISNVVVDSIKNSIFYDNNTKYCVVDFAIDNSVLNLATTAVQNEALVSFKMGGAKDFNVTNSTIYGNGIAKYFIRYNNSARLDRYGFDKTTEFQTMNYQNNTFYNVIQAGGQWGNYGGIGGQNYSKFDVQKNIWYNSSNEIIRRMAGGRFSGSNPMTFAKNTYFYNDADNSAKEASYDKSGDILITDPTFADAATGNFTLHVGTQQAKEKTGDPRWLVEYDATQAFALPIVVDVTEGDILAAVDSVKATVDKVGDITINLAKGTTYTVSNSVLAPANLVINGDSAIIDATALAAPMIITDTVALAEWKTIETIAVNNVVVKGLGAALFQSSGKNLNITNFVVDNSIVEIAKDVTVFDFTKGSVAMNFTVKNSTLYAPTATTKSLYSSQSAQKGSEAGATAEAPQTFSFENTTLYNLATNKNFFTHRSASQTWMKYVVKNNVVVNTGKANFMTTINQGQDNKNPQYDVTINSVGTLADGTYTDLSASQMVQSVVMGTLVTTDPQFKDAAAADFTVYAGSDQAKEKIGDPRWLVEFDETLSGIEGITTDGSSVNGANNDAWYNLQGVRVNGKPTQKGIYIHNGKKIVVK